MPEDNSYSSADPRKIQALEYEAIWRDRRRGEHPLKELLLELTDACNLSCLHCGSSCEADGDYLAPDKVLALIDEVAEAYEPAAMRISFTGGEPMLHPDFMKIAKYAVKKGFQTGMTTNGTRITQKKAEKLAKMGFGVVTVSLDGMKKSHDAFRNRKGSWKLAVEGIDNLLAAGIVPSVTTVANSLNISELEEMREFLAGKGIQVWRVLNIDPIGRAMEHPELLLDAEGSAAMWTFIEDRRINHADELPRLTASCSHYLGPVHELETRDWPFSCRSGVTVASVTAKGEYVGCLDVERRDSLVMGHLGEDSFVEAWEGGYAPYRESRVPSCELCSVCEHARYCDGDSMHTWDFEANMPKLCIGAADALAALEELESESREEPLEEPEESAKTACEFSDKTTKMLDKLQEMFPPSIPSYEVRYSDRERQFLVNNAIAKIEAHRKLEDIVNTKKEPELDNLVNGYGKADEAVNEKVPEGDCPCDDGGTGKSENESPTRNAVGYLENHQDDEDADDLAETVRVFTRAGFRAGVLTAAVIGLGAWLLLGRKR